LACRPLLRPGSSQFPAPSRPLLRPCPACRLVLGSALHPAWRSCRPGA